MLAPTTRSAQHRFLWGQSGHSRPPRAGGAAPAAAPVVDVVVVVRAQSLPLPDFPLPTTSPPHTHTHTTQKKAEFKLEDIETEDGVLVLTADNFDAAIKAYDPLL